MIPSTQAGQGQHHKRTKSSVLRSIIIPRNHKRNPSSGAAISCSIPTDSQNSYDPAITLPLLHIDSPNTKTAPLGELFRNQECVPTSPKKQTSRPDDRPATSPGKPSHEKTLSSVSLSSFVAKQKEKGGKSKNEEGTGDESKDAGKKPKKSKSQTNLQALLSRPKSSRGYEQALESRNSKDKENRTPPTSPMAMPPPIYAQFTSQPLQSAAMTNRPWGIVSDVDREMSLYTPQAYTPSKQRNFHGLYEGPTLAKRDVVTSKRPKSAYLPSSTSTSSFAETLAGIRKSSTNRALPSVLSRDVSGKEKKPGAGQTRRVSWEERVLKQRSSGEDSRPIAERPKEGLTVAKRGSRVMAAVAALNGKSKDSSKEVQMSPKNIESAFEALLDSRNVPQNMRQKLRSLDVHIKEDFIKQDKAESATAHSASRSVGATLWGTKSAIETPVMGQQERAEGGRAVAGIMKEDPFSPGKRARPRSKTFSISRADISPSKKQKSDSGVTERVKSSNFPTSNSTTSLHSSGNAQATTTGLVGKPKPAIPEEFFAYLRKVQKPEDVEVGRLHKLRLVLRNERVAWVDSFITMGGMDEITSLLHRIMKVEWRALFLNGNAVTYLEAASAHERASRAQTILSHLRDPSPPEDAQPLGFIIDMHQPRPYRVWCKEIVSVTKEVFWIFIHGLNVVPIAPAPAVAESETYMQTHFPRERPPVPAAPYVGGVEWEATNYLANHLDLMNGLIASLPTYKERNVLREELKVSGFEKMMGISLRTCKEKFYGAVHDGLKTWVAAAAADGWDVKDVRMGPPATEKKERGSPKKKKNIEESPKMELPKLELGDAGQKEEDAWVY
ncbi:hypothetical protein GP486_002177 [Trichoglossum hirsutum]|uniref:Formin GTPase-binding domain-containing protein n=1 Tax=Trichoglossum hirsutum TaxID=265104 RepID=A0A9P8LFJ9_9PEZI|nr:hypothetical protein GP486_002177 [Trichoglossum hirsutum]